MIVVGLREQKLCSWWSIFYPDEAMTNACQNESVRKQQSTTIGDKEIVI